MAEDITKYNKKKELEVTDVSDEPTISHAVPIKITSGDDSQTGTGDIVLDWTNINGKEDIAVYDENDTLLDYYFESLDASNEKAVIHVYRDWVRDGSKQAQIVYGDGPSDQSSSASTVFDKEKDNSNLVSGWLLNETSGDALDVTSNNNDGTVNGATQGVDGQVGGAYEFDGEDDYVEVADADSLNPNKITVSAWFKTNELPDGEDIHIVSKWDAGNDDRQYLLQLDDGDEWSWWISREGDSWKEIRTSSPSMETNKWYHMVGTFNGTDLNLYLDGDLIGSKSVESGDIHKGPADFRVGWVDDWGPSDKYFNGSIDEVMIFNKSLNSTEIEAKYDASKSSPTFFSQESATNLEFDATVTPDSQTLTITEKEIGVKYDYTLGVETQDLSLTEQTPTTSYDYTVSLDKQSLDLTQKVININYDYTVGLDKQELTLNQKTGIDIHSPVNTTLILDKEELTLTKKEPEVNYDFTNKLDKQELNLKEKDTTISLSKIKELTKQSLTLTKQEPNTLYDYSIFPDSIGLEATQKEVSVSYDWIFGVDKQTLTTNLKTIEFWDLAKYKTLNVTINERNKFNIGFSDKDPMQLNIEETEQG